MNKWEEFEIDSTNYLNSNFGEYAEFIHQGNSNSTVPDISVKTKSGTGFYIEVKLTPAQCGQFVVLPCFEQNIFEYSHKNVNKINPYAETIIEYMNNNFDKFKSADTKGLSIELSEDIFADWIIHTYKQKGVKFIITNGFKLFSIEDLSLHFKISAVYRIKRSGSCSVGKTRFSEVSKYISNEDYQITAIHKNNDKLFVSSVKPLDNKKFHIGNYEYMFSKRDEMYEVRRLSNTYNANVIFSITEKSKKEGISEEDFINYLK